MAEKIPVKKWLFFFLLILSVSFAVSAKKTYIIQMDKWAKPQVFSDHVHWYESIVKSVVSDQVKKQQQQQQETETETEPENRILYTYSTAFHGVAAQLTQQEMENLAEKSGVIAVFPENIYQLHTTRSPLFLGLESVTGNNIRFDRKSFSNDVIVGVLDTGIWPESGSFNDSGMGPVPPHWKGSCETGRGFTGHHCNRKIVGAKMFYHGYEASTGRINGQDEFKSPRDQDGHGTHTAGTAVGSPTGNANLFGYASGTATGMAPNARVAVYKVCWGGGCFSSDILSAIDQAVSDGVNVLSISLGGVVSSYYRDSLSVAAFGAMEKGIFISCSAGNGGPDPVSLTNVSPWITTVGASTMDREFPAIVKLGNGKILKGSSLYRGVVMKEGRQYPLVYLGANSSSPTPSSLCLEGTLDRGSVEGKIVICDRGISPRVQKGQVVKDAGGVGMVLTNTAANGEELVADSHLLPAVAVGESLGTFIKHYAYNNKGTANLQFLGTKLGVKPSPVVAAFSSRGPNLLSLEILKPDLVAPGVNILAAWTGDLGPSSLPSDHRRTKFNILSGTSMSCPHVSGIAALIKANHFDWSPAAIKSALMTTAYVHDNTYNLLKDASTNAPSTPYDHGAGHINPMKALDPGLVYDIDPQDYFEFLCAQKLTTSELSVFGKFSKRVCQRSYAHPGDLNYPAISVVFSEEKNVSVIVIHRTVTNVGPPVSDYHVVVSPFKNAVVKVEPEKLSFRQKNEKLSFKVVFRKGFRQTQPEFGSLIWKSKTHKVRSPIVVTYLQSI